MEKEAQRREFTCFQDFVDDLIERTLKRMEKGVPNTGDFAPVLELFSNLSTKTDNIVGKYGLQIYKMPSDVVADPTIRFVEAAAYTPSGRYKAKLIVASGTKTEIYDTMQTEEFAQKLHSCYAKLLKILRES